MTNFRIRKSENYHVYRGISILLCTLLNVILTFITRYYGIPLYLDTIGTIFVSITCGSFAGILTAVITNLICTLFSPEYLFFSILGVITALVTAWFSKNEKLNKKLNYVWLVLILALINGILGTIFQWIIAGKPELSYVSESAKILAGNDDQRYVVFSLLLIIGLNIIDKGISVLVSVIFIKMISQETLSKIWDGGWKQNPLSKSEVKSINSSLRNGLSSLRIRVLILLCTAVILIGIIFGWVSSNTSYNTNIKNGNETVNSVASLITKSLVSDSYDDYLNDNSFAIDYSNSDYKKDNDYLHQVQNSFQNIIDIFIIKSTNDGIYILFDTDDEFQKEGRIGENIESQLIYYDDILPDLKEHKDIAEPHTLNTDYTYIITSFKRIYASDNTPSEYYVGVEYEMPRYSDHLNSYVIKMLMTSSGFFVLILAYGLWISGHYLIYPIGSLERRIDGFMKGIDDQKKLDESVKKLQKLDIRTNDEVEKLYNSICEMALGTSEQMRNIRSLAKSNEKMQTGLIITMADMVENRDSDTGAHIQKTAAYVKIILNGLKRKGYYPEKLSDKYINDVIMSAPLHDIGKINVPDAVLNKPGKLTPEEYEIIKTHTTAGKKILENAISTVEGENYLKEARNMAAYHHERWDGKGYPEGLHGQVIPLSARVMAVADVFDALASQRVYKPAYPFEKAINIIEEGAGTQFDPKCVEVFMESLDEVKNVLRKYQEIDDTK